MQTTLEEIRSNGPCKDGWKLLTKTLGRITGPVTLKEIYESNGHKDAVWCLRCFPFESYRPWLVEVIEAALPAFEKEFPDDKRLRQAVEAIKSGATKKELERVSVAAHASYAVSYAAYYAANAAVRVNAIYAFVALASRASAANAAAYAVLAATYAARAADTYTAAAYAADAPKAASPETVEPIFIKHFCQESQ